MQTDLQRFSLSSQGTGGAGSQQIAKSQSRAVSALTSANSSSSASTASTSEASITANDFLTLLVSELKNQDPTAQTDPNEYVNQLVQVNSLEQLISINQDLTPATTTNTSGARTGVAAMGTTAPVSNATEAATRVSPGGNLSVPVTGNRAARVATALQRSSTARPLTAAL